MFFLKNDQTTNVWASCKNDYRLSMIYNYSRYVFDTELRVG